MKLKKCLKWMILLVLLLAFGMSVPAEEAQTETEAVDDGCYNLLLIGSDRRDKSWNGNSDTMVLVTFNDKKQQMYLTSFMRDLYADIPGYGVKKMNAAFAIGGPQLCVQTIKENYKVKIDNYAAIDFMDMIDVIELLGGVDVAVEDYEVDDTNRFIASLCASQNVSSDDHMIMYSGLQRLDGYQAVQYARNRSSGNTYDFGRTERQRKVLFAVLDRFQTIDIPSLSAAIPDILELIDHDVQPMTQLKILLNVQKWMSYEMKEQRVPFDGEWYSSNEILIPTDMAATIQKLNDTLYGE